MDNLSDKLNSCDTGCVNGSTVMNHFMYADDLVVFPPYSCGLARLLEVCEEYGIENDIVYNPSKSAMMTIRSRSDKYLS